MSEEEKLAFQLIDSANIIIIDGFPEIKQINSTISDSTTSVKLTSQVLLDAADISCTVS